MQKRPLGVMMISRTFYPDVDGSVIAISNLLKCLYERGHKLYLITRRLPRAPLIEKWKNIHVVRVGPSNPSLIFRLILSLNQARAGFALMKKEHVDVIHAHGAHSLLAGLILSKMFHKPIIVTFHGFQRLWFKSVRWKRESTLKFTYPFGKFIITLVDAIIAQSQTLKITIAQLYKINLNKIHVIPHAIDEGCFNFVPSPSSQEPIVLLVGRLARVHGVDLLIKAAPYVLKDAPQTKFMIVGGGPQKQYLQKLIKDLNLEKSVFLVGPVLDQNELAKYYAAASVVVVPLKYKGYILSLVALEAMSTGRPVVTTMTLDPDVYKFGVRKVGFNPADLAQAIKEILLLNKEEYRILAASVRKYVEERCSKGIISSEIENLYMHLVRFH